MKPALLGGTFNPVHNGHLHLARAVIGETDCTDVIFVPSNKPAHKEIKGSATPQDRLNMLEAAVWEAPRFRVNDCEIRRGGVSYTIDTVRYLVSMYNLTQPPILVIGDDLIDGFSEWKCVDRLVELTELVVAHRKTGDRRPCPYPHTYLHNEVEPISSRQIRAWCAEGRSISAFVPPAVEAYIRTHGLYQDPELTA